ncbi:MAG TPA: hypothetical protein VJQ52_01520 [Steroidobacteraceae bacterium]|nr:hypothetical protein [Steroidobacteraceae bacterium]
MRASTEVSMYLTAQELLSLPEPTGMVEVDDIGAVDPLPPARAANAPHAPADDSIVEIELTAEQIGELLSAL